MVSPETRRKRATISSCRGVLSLCQIRSLDVRAIVSSKVFWSSSTLPISMLASVVFLLCELCESEPSLCKKKSRLYCRDVLEAVLLGMCRQSRNAREMCYLWAKFALLWWTSAKIWKQAYRPCRWKTCVRMPEMKGCTFLLRLVQKKMCGRRFSLIFASCFCLIWFYIRFGEWSWYAPNSATNHNAFTYVIVYSNPM